MIINALNGLVYGSLLFVLASGLVLVYGLRRVVNFAHGALYMLGAYVGYSVAIAAGFLPGVIAAAVVLTLVGVLLDLVVFRKLADRDPLVTVLVTFGVLLILEDFVRTVWGTQNYTIDPPPALSGVVEIAGAPFPVYRLFIVAASALMAGGMVVWLRYTRSGLWVRAASHSPAVAAMCGVRTNVLGPLVVGLGAAFAGVAGIVAAPFLSLNPSMGSEILVLSFVVSVIGGLGSFGGAFISAMLLGQIQAFGVVYLPEMAALLPFLLMALVLVARPQGILGTKV
ncbi:MAG: branched-chain amino acid ABC transporter permease [Rhodobiaceae bacterium]|nr:branched-chain amino acid ABC transporter permease [Rhodobiaceae bacterium]MCC0042644.1 branched-chain amino acid ABC transporter permease [Rhodobiaceae bacterium]